MSKPVAETSPTIGEFNVKEVRGATCVETSKAIIFARPYEKSPHIPMGFTKLYIGSNANVRVASSASKIRRDRFQININGCKNTNLDSATCAWLEISPDDRDFQSGRFSTLDHHPYEEPSQPSVAEFVTFRHPYCAPPDVVVWLTAFDMGRGSE